MTPNTERARPQCSNIQSAKPRENMRPPPSQAFCRYQRPIDAPGQYPSPPPSRRAKAPLRRDDGWRSVSRASQTLREDSRRPANAPASGVRCLQHRFRRDESPEQRVCSALRRKSGGKRAAPQPLRANSRPLTVPPPRSNFSGHEIRVRKPTRHSD
jgi:hypothetical protein